MRYTEVVKQSAKEIQRKPGEYFEAGVRLVWCVNPLSKTVTAYTRPNAFVVLGEEDTLAGGRVLPGLKVDLKALFETPKRPKR